MKEEYKSLRAEIGNWQNFLFMLAGVATAFVSVVIGFERKQGGRGQTSAGPLLDQSAR